MGNGGRGGRSQRRAGYNVATRLSLLEDDVDGIERVGEQLERTMNRLLISVVGASLSFVLMTVLLAIDIARGR